MKTLKDYIDFNLEILSIGLNPSTISVERGYYFANPRNRFWSALNASDLVPEILKPSEASQDKLFEKYKIGFTDVAKRHSSMGKDMLAADFKNYAPVLESVIIKYQPKICWFHGKVAINKFLQYSSLNKNEFGQGRKIDWGLQNFKINTSTVFVTPNPSPANAAYSLDTIIEWYNKLKALDCGGEK
jgi:TDG/mug DNA glycosylase family protein